MKAHVIKLDRQTHPNADQLFVQKVGDTQVCGRIQDWEGKTHAVYVPPGAVVDTDMQQFSWLKAGDERFHTVKPRNMRGIESFGLMVEAPADLREGDDVTEAYRIKYT